MLQYLIAYGEFFIPDCRVNFTIVQDRQKKSFRKHVIARRANSFVADLPGKESVYLVEVKESNCYRMDIDRCKAPEFHGALHL